MSEIFRYPQVFLQCNHVAQRNGKAAQNIALRYSFMKNMIEVDG